MESHKFESIQSTGRVAVSLAIVLSPMVNMGALLASTSTGLPGGIYDTLALMLLILF